MAEQSLRSGEGTRSAIKWAEAASVPLSSPTTARPTAARPTAARTTRLVRRAVIVAIVLWAIPLTPSAGAADPIDADNPTDTEITAPTGQQIQPSAITPHIIHDVWMINTRHITSDACRADLNNPRFVVSQYDGRGRMVAADQQQLVDLIRQDPMTPTVIYIHGNNFAANEVYQRAFFVRQKILCCRNHAPMRFIIWSWPSEQVTSILKDVRIKADRTDAQGLYLALFLRQVADAPRPISLIGYSFGGRIVTGGLHALAGGHLGCRVIPGPHVTGFTAGIGLIAPALDRDWLMRGEYHGLATKNIDRIALMYNPRDQVLRQYWLLDPSDRSRALGAVGLMRFGTRLDNSAMPIKSYNCSRWVGRRHSEEDYFSSDCRAGCVMARLIDQP
jgi:hypothetical protein